MEIREYQEYQEDEILRLYSGAGWTAYTSNMSALRQGFEHSLSVLGAYEKNELLGIIRTVGDGSTIVFIQDLLVFPEKRRQGVGTALVREVLKRYADVRQIVLVTDRTPQTEAFYQSLGLLELSSIGCCGFMRC